MPSKGQVDLFTQSARAHASKPKTNFDSTTCKTLVRTVKLTVIIMLAGLLQVSARTTAQTRISISLRGATLEKVFSEVEKRSGYTVFYNTEVLRMAGSNLVTVDMKDATIEDVMHQCLKGLPLEFTVQDKTIFVKKEIKHVVVAPAPGPGSPMPSTFGGIVRNEAGAPLMGASVFVIKLKKTVVTDKDGEFSLKNIPDGEYEVIISYIGFENYRTNVTVQNHEAWLSADLKQSMSKLDESVVIAYGTTTERLNTGDVSKVTSKEIEEQPVGNVLEALEGRVPGLFVTQNNGVPGGSFNIQIRGQNSIINGNNPFFVIDGVPYNSQLPAAPINTVLDGGSPLNFINPYDIESIEVLKDADATAIYGSRAANGAILITTKKGKTGDLKFDVNVKTGVSNPARTMPILNGKQYLEMRHEAFNNDGQTPGSGDHDINGDWDTTRNIYWPALMANKPSQYTDAETSVSGGNTNTQYLIGGGYFINRTGFPTLLPGDGGDKKGSVHFNVNTTSTDKRFRIFLTGSYMADKNTVQSADFTNTAISLAPDAPPVFNPDGSLNWAPLAPGETGTWANPYAGLNSKYASNTSNLVSNALISYTVLRGLELQTSLGYTNTQTNEIHTLPTTIRDPASQTTSGTSTFGTANSHSWIVEPQADYKARLGRGILSALAGASFEQNNSSNVIQNANGFISDALLEDVQAASSVSVSSNSSIYKYEAVFGRLNYDWMDKYLVSLTTRRDGTSRFGPGRQFGNFGAVGAGWIFSKEDFIQKHLGFLSFGKIRGSYGTTGNDQVGDYQFVDLYTTTTYPYEGLQGLYPTNLFNAKLAWETTKKLEGGIELGFFKDRVMLQASWFRNRSGNELVQTPVSQVTGFQTISANLPALVQNSGGEFVLSTMNIKTKNFVWSSSFNLTIARNKLVAFPNLANSAYANKLVIGKPVSILKVFHCLGVNDSTGLYEFSSLKTGPTYSPDPLADLNGLVDLTPRYYGGFNNSLTYKGFGLDFFFQFVKQTGLRLWASYNAMPGMMLNQPTEVLNRWEHPGDKKPFQQFSQNYGGDVFNAFSYAQQSDFAYGDASFIRLKNVAFSWQMPQGWSKKMRLSNFRIYFQAQNLLTITKYDGIDPENQTAVTGPRRTYVGGIQFGW